MNQFNKDLLSIIDTSNKLVDFARNNPDDDRIYNLVLILIHFENILDKSRIFLEQDTLNDLPLINKSRDALSRNIHELIKKLDLQELNSALDTAGENFKLYR